MSNIRRSKARLVEELAEARRRIAELRASESPGGQDDETRLQLAATVDSIDDAVIGRTLDGVITSWNPGAERIYGYSAEEAIGRPVSLLAPRGYRKDLEGILERIRR